MTEDEAVNWMTIGFLIIIGIWLTVMTYLVISRRNKNKDSKIKKIDKQNMKLITNNRNNLKETLTQPILSKLITIDKSIKIKSAINYEKAKVIYKVKVENNSEEPIARIRIKPYLSDNVFILDKDEKGLDLLQPNESATITFILRPKGECGNVVISGKIVYYDYHTKEYKELKIEPKTTAIVCPMMKVVQIDENSWRNNVSKMIKVEETTEEIPFEAKALFDIMVDVVRDINCYMLKPKITDASGMFRGVGRFYCEGVKGLKYAIHAEVIGGKTKSKLILKAFAENEESLIGFYHCILDEIQKRTKIKEYIHDSLIVQGDYVTGRKIEVKDSVVYKSRIDEKQDFTNKVINKQNQKDNKTSPTNLEFKSTLNQIFMAAQDKGLPYVELRAGDLHRQVGGYPGSNHRMPVCCSVMKQNMKPGDELLKEPPSGMGASLTIRYKLPR